MFSKFVAARIVLFLEIACQIVVIATEAISFNGNNKPPVGQSIFVFIASVMSICLAIYVEMYMKSLIEEGFSQLSFVGICFAAASIIYRTVTSWFFDSYDPIYYTTSIFIVLGSVAWIPLGFCKDTRYNTIQESNNRHSGNNEAASVEVEVHRPNHDEEEGDAPPSYYEMVSPPVYRTKRTESSIIVNGSSA